MSVRGAYGLCRQVVVWSLLLLAVSALRGQSVAAWTQAAGGAVKLPAYDVVSVKPNKTGDENAQMSLRNGSFSATNVSLKMMITAAWHLKDAQLIGLPKWGDATRFDIKAKVLEPDEKVFAALTPEQYGLMQQPFLSDRFQLKYHFEKKVLPVYELVVAKGGPKFKETTRSPAPRTLGVDGVRGGSLTIRNNTLTATVVPISTLANDLSWQVKRIVVDKTGLTGQYNFQMRWTPDDAGPAATDASPEPDIFTALQEQLGLKLEPGKAEEEVFVVDHVEMPAAD